MQKIVLKSFVVASILAFAGCKEQPIEIPELGQGIVSQRKVLVEEFTGVACVNCPQGAAELANLKGIYGENLVIVSIHAGEFADPLPESKYNFKTEEGTSLENYLGTPIGYPTAVVNRKKFAGANSLQAFKNQWSGFIQQDLAIAPSIALNAVPSFEAASRKLDVSVTILPSKNLTGEHRISLMLTENHIIDAQEDGGNLVEDYEHEHVLRDMLTPFDGTVLTENLQIGVPIVKQFSMILPVDFKAENCKIVTFIHHGGTPDKEILQADEVSVIE
jgi:hypothetical protein